MHAILCTFREVKRAILIVGLLLIYQACYNPVFRVFPRVPWKCLPGSPGWACRPDKSGEKIVKYKTTHMTKYRASSRRPLLRPTILRWLFNKPSCYELFPRSNHSQRKPSRKSSTLFRKVLWRDCVLKDCCTPMPSSYNLLPHRHDLHQNSFCQ